MHIPDGYLSPQTCTVMYVAMLPVWMTAVRKLKQALKTKYIPLMMIGAAFTFIIMMFNIPIPDGTTGHAVGGSILAIVLGPWAATICITIALAIQALLFGDGGIWAFAANCFNMAFVLPFASYFIYRLIAGKAPIESSRHWIGGLIAGFVGLNLAALCAAIEFGLQPAWFHTASGTPLYCPYPLSQAVPAMVLAHLLVPGPAEAVVTALLVRYLQSTNPSLLNIYGTTHQGKGLGKLWWGMAILVLLSPLGLLAPGTAWGEWSLNQVKELVGMIPAGMAGTADKWRSIFPDYGLPGFDATFGQSATIYMLSAVIGICVIILITYLFARFVGVGREIENKGEGISSD